MILISAAGVVDGASGGKHGIRTLDTTTELHEAGGVPSAQTAAHAKAVRVSEGPSAGSFRRRLPGGVGVDVPRYGRGPGAGATSVARDDRAIAKLPGRVRRRGRGVDGGGPALADGARLPRRHDPRLRPGNAGRFSWAAHSHRHGPTVAGANCRVGSSNQGVRLQETAERVARGHRFQPARGCWSCGRHHQSAWPCRPQDRRVCCRSSALDGGSRGS